LLGLQAIRFILPAALLWPCARLRSFRDGLVPMQPNC